MADPSSDVGPREAEPGTYPAPVQPLRTLRIQLPLDCHMRLHEVKLITGITLSQIVGQALDKYLQDAPRAPPTRRADPSAAARC